MDTSLLSLSLYQSISISLSTFLSLLSLLFFTHILFHRAQILQERHAAMVKEFSPTNLSHGAYISPLKTYHLQLPKHTPPTSTQTSKTADQKTQNNTLGIQIQSRSTVGTTPEKKGDNSRQTDTPIINPRSPPTRPTRKTPTTQKEGTTNQKTQQRREEEEEE